MTARAKEPQDGVGNIGNGSMLYKVTSDDGRGTVIWCTPLHGLEGLGAEIAPAPRATSIIENI